MGETQVFECIECGHPNPVGTVNCAQCNASLPVTVGGYEWAGQEKPPPIQAEPAERLGAAERRAARNWYWWLWLSPLVTVPTLLVVFGLESYYRVDELLAVVIAVLGSALWHLILLFPVLSKKSEFARWHGRQALALAGVRTGLAMPGAWGFYEGNALMLMLAPLILVWFFGTLLGQRQAARGQCSLMRWLGRDEAFLPPGRAEEPAQVAESDADALVDIIRHSRDREERRRAVLELEKRGMVEEM